VVHSTLYSYTSGIGKRLLVLVSVKLSSGTQCVTGVRNRSDGRTGVSFECCSVCGRRRIGRALSSVTGHEEHVPGVCSA
jgi:hypothetical protein